MGRTRSDIFAVIITLRTGAIFQIQTDLLEVLIISLCQYIPIYSTVSDACVLVYLLTKKRKSHLWSTLIDAWRIQEITTKRHRSPPHIESNTRAASICACAVSLGRHLVAGLLCLEALFHKKGVGSNRHSEII